MKTLLVVEDEKMIRRGICTIAKRSGVPIDEILECGNGEEALEIIKDRNIDVVFTDIRMPKMDGIELVHRIQELESKPQIVAISGYDDFSYAVEMLRNGVKEYILKPVDRDKISDILKKLNEEIENRDARAKNDIEIGKQSLRYVLTNEPASNDEIEVLKEKFDPLFFSEEYVVVCVGNKEQITPYYGIVEITDVGDSNVYLLEAGELDNFLEEELTDCYVGISDRHKGIENVRSAYKEAADSRKKAFCLCRTVYFTEEGQKISEALKEQALKLLEPQESERRLQLIGTGRIDELIKQWDKIFTAVERQQISEEYFEASQEKFIEGAIRTYRTSMSEEEYERLQSFRHTLSFASLQEYRENFMNLIIYLNEKINSCDEDSLLNQKMKKALSYINENYNADINMAVVSNYVSMNYSLFSFSFKQFTGKNFVNYLKDLRVEAAKKMLSETDMKVIEISQCVGYDNEKHFMKLFKNYCGVSPTEYRKNMQR